MTKSRLTKKVQLKRGDAFKEMDQNSDLYVNQG
jgi:hypothetical protein